MKLHHVGILVNDLDKASSVLAGLCGIEQSDATLDEYRKIQIKWAKMDGGRLELIKSDAPDSAVAGLLKRNGVGPYHICCESEEPLEDTIQRLKSSGFIVISKPQPAPAIDGRRVAFLYNRQIGIIEILEGNNHES